MRSPGDARISRRSSRFSPLVSPPVSGRINAYDKTWEDWVKRTGELPPDFEAMPSIANLPDPLLLTKDGRQIAVTNEAQWNRQKQWIRSQMEQWVFGKMPPPPDNLRAVVTSTRREGTTTVRDVRLEFGPDHRATLTSAIDHSRRQRPVPRIPDQPQPESTLGSTPPYGGAILAATTPPMIRRTEEETLTMPTGTLRFTRSTTSPVSRAGHGRLRAPWIISSR